MIRWRPADFALRYQVLFPLYARLPPSWAYRLAALQAGWFRRKRPAEEAAIRTQLHQVFPAATSGQVEAWLAAHYRMVEQEALDTWYLGYQPINRIVELQGFDAVAAARRAGRRVVLTSGHFGRFWLAGAAMRAAGYTTGSITRDGGLENKHGLHPAEHRYRLFKLARLQRVLGGPFLVEGDDPRPLYHALDNHLIALIFDVPYAQPHPGRVVVPFLGGQAAFPAGVWRVARKMDALVAPFFMHELGQGRVRAEFGELLDPHAYDAASLLAELAKQLEQHIRASPGHWWLWPALPLLWGNHAG